MLTQIIEHYRRIYCDKSLPQHNISQQISDYSNSYIYFKIKLDTISLKFRRVYEKYLYHLTTCLVS